MTERKRFALYGSNEETPELDDLIELPNGRWARFNRMSNEDHNAVSLVEGRERKTEPGFGRIP
jgi:hypothetical protein